MNTLPAMFPIWSISSSQYSYVSRRVRFLNKVERELHGVSWLVEAVVVTSLSPPVLPNSLHPLQVSDHHEGALGSARATASHWESQAQKSLQISEETVRRTAAILEQQRLDAEDAQRRAAVAQELELATKFERRANEERATRHAAIDAV
jgi:hypothetical protein